MDSTESLLLACYAGFRVSEVPTRIRKRSAGQPSTRHVRLVLHYLRLLVVIVSHLSRLPSRSGGARMIASHAPVHVDRSLRRARTFSWCSSCWPAPSSCCGVLNRRQMRGKYTLLWMFVGVAVLALAAYPASLDHVSHFLHIYYAPSTLFLAAIGFLFLVCVYFSFELSRLEERTRVLAEELAILRAEQEANGGERADDHLTQ